MPGAAVTPEIIMNRLPRPDLEWRDLLVLSRRQRLTNVLLSWLWLAASAYLAANGAWLWALPMSFMFFLCTLRQAHDSYQRQSVFLLCGRYTVAVIPTAFLPVPSGGAGSTVSPCICCITSNTIYLLGCRPIICRSWRAGSMRWRRSGPGSGCWYRLGLPAGNGPSGCLKQRFPSIEVTACVGPF